MNFYHLLEKSKEYLHLAKEYKLETEEKITASIELAALIVQMSQLIESADEKQNNKERHRLLQDKRSRRFLTQVTDHIHHSPNPKRTASHISTLLKKNGIPKGLPWLEQLQLRFFPLLAKLHPSLSIYLCKQKISNETSHFILPQDHLTHAKKLKKANIKPEQVNLNYLGEVTLSEDAAETQCHRLIQLCQNSGMKAISIKLSSLYSQDIIIDHIQAQQLILNRLHKICDICLKHNPKLLLYFDMEHLSDLYFTVEILKHLLESAKYKNLYFGIALQAYLPHSVEIQEQLTTWAVKRVENGGTPIRIRLVKGANLAMEKVRASATFQNTPVYPNKNLVDINFKKMIQYGVVTRHAHAAHIGVGTHNIFDLAYTLLERSEKNTEKFVGFEMIYGMNPSIFKTIELLTDNLLLYVPTIDPEHLDLANSYLFRRIDEQTQPENFLTHQYKLEPGSKVWQDQVERFQKSFQQEEALQKIDAYHLTHRPSSVDFTHFKNWPCTNWALKEHRSQLETYYKIPLDRIPKTIPFTVGKTLVYESASYLNGVSPNTQQSFYHVALINNDELDDVFGLAKQTLRHNNDTLETYKSWAQHIIDKLEANRHQLCATMIHDVAKPLVEADLEINEAIDFVQYYLNQRLDLEEKHSPISPKGVGLVCSPWNFPLAIPLGCIFSSLICGNVVLFKPAEEAALVAWQLVSLLWEAGIPKDRLQFIPCSEEISGKKLLSHPNLDYINLTGATSTAQYFLSQNPKLDISAETGGKNAMIISNLCDIDEAIENTLKSAFSFAGQKCSASSLLLCHQDLYHNTEFLSKLKQACLSLSTSSALNKGCYVPPLIRTAGKDLNKALTELDPGETWLVEPKQSPDNPLLWTPGIKLGIQANSHFNTTECFGPVLGVVPIQNITEGIDWINRSDFALTAGLQSLDETEHQRFIHNTSAGNLYINKATTGAIVGLQPFGGRRNSRFGTGYKAGGPHYLKQFCYFDKRKLNSTSQQIPNLPKRFLALVHHGLGDQFKQYCADMNHFESILNDLSNVTSTDSVYGEDNLYFCEPKENRYYRVSPQDTFYDFSLIISQTLMANVTLILSFETAHFHDISVQDIQHHIDVDIHIQSPEGFQQLIAESKYHSIRSIESDLTQHLPLLHKQNHQVVTGPIQDNEMECLALLNEKSVSRKSHRYGFID